MTLHVAGHQFVVRTLPWLLLMSALCMLMGCSPPRSPVNAQDALVFKGRLSRVYLPTEGDTLLYAQLRIGPGTVPAPTRSNVNLALVIDSSGSMEGEAIARAKQAAQSMLSVMVDGDRLALVSFDTEVEVLLPSTVIDDEQRERVAELIDRLHAKGTTNLRDGLTAGIAEVERHLDKDGINGIVLLGDGLPNNAVGIEALAANAGARQIRITSLGLGLDYNEALMAAIAQRSGGRFHYIDEPNKVAAFFKDEVLRMQRIYAQNMQLELVLGPGVEHEFLGREPNGAVRRVTVPLGDLSHRESVDVMLRLHVPARGDGAAVEILDAKLSYRVPLAGGAEAQQRVYLGAHASDDVLQLAVVDRKIEHAAAVAEAAHATLIAVSRARGGQRSKAEEVIDFAIERLQAQSKHGGKKELSGRVDELRTLRNNLPKPQPVPATSTTVHSFDSDELVVEAPDASPAQQRQLKRTHDSAVQNFSAY